MDSEKLVTKGDTWTCFRCSYSMSTSYSLVMHIENFHDNATRTPTNNSVTKKSKRKKFGLLQSMVNPCFLKNHVQVKLCFVPLNGFKCTECLYFASHKELLIQHSQDEHTENNKVMPKKKSKIAKLEQVTKILNEFAKTPKTQKTPNTTKCNKSPISTSNSLGMHIEKLRIQLAQIKKIKCVNYSDLQAISVFLGTKFQ